MQRPPSAANRRVAEAGIGAPSSAQTASDPPSQTADIATANVIEATRSAMAGQSVVVMGASVCRPNARRISSPIAGPWASGHQVPRRIVTAAGRWGVGGAGSSGGGVGDTGLGVTRDDSRRVAGTVREPK